MTASLPLARRIQLRLGAQGQTLESLARERGIPSATLRSRINRFGPSTRIGSIQELATLLGVDVAWILDDTRSPLEGLR